METYTEFLDWKTQYGKDGVSPKLVYKLHAVLLKISRVVVFVFIFV